MGTIRVELGEDLMQQINDGKTVTISLVGPEGRKPGEGSLGARICAWALERSTAVFDTDDLLAAFPHLTRQHASMTLSRLANGPSDIVRVGRGLYVHKDRSKPKRKKKR